LLFLAQQLAAVGNPALARCQEISHFLMRSGRTDLAGSDQLGIREWYRSCSSTHGHFNHQGDIAMRKLILGSALALALAVGVPAISSAGVIFDVDQTVGAGGVTGTITTDGTLGALVSANLVDWNLTLNDGTTTFLLTAANSERGIFSGTPLTETPTQLLFDTTNGGAVLFQNPAFASGVNLWCLDNASGSCNSLPGTESLRINGAIQKSSWQGIVVIGTAEGAGAPAAVRQPATLMLLGLGLGGLALVTARRRR
jgi:hypothetical protein